MKHKKNRKIIKGKRKERKKGIQNRKCHQILTKKKKYKKIEARAKEIAKKYLIERSKKIKTNRKRTD